MSRSRNRFYRLLRRLDRVFFRVTALGLAALFLTQALLLSPQVRKRLNYVEMMEGEPVSAARRVLPEAMPPVPIKHGSVAIALEGRPYSEAVLLRNGEEIGNFSCGSIAFDVQTGDLLEIDGGMKRIELVFSVVEVSAGVIEPMAGKTIVTDGSIEIIARVKIE